MLDGSVRVSTDGLATSTQVLASGGLILEVTSIAVDPNNPSLAYVSRWGHRANMFTEFFKVTNEGGAWQSTPLQNPPSQNINIIAVGPDSKTVIVGTDHGVYYSTDETASWSLLGQGLPNGVVSDLEIASTATGSTRSITLYAATFGRGIWSFNLGMSTLPVPDFSISANPRTVSASAGTGTSTTITVTAVQGLTGIVTLTTDNPACSLTPSFVTGSGSSTLSCTFTSAPRTRSVTVTITASGGVQTHSTSVTYTVISGTGGGGGGTGEGGTNGVQLAIGAAVLFVGVNWIGGAIIGASLALKRRSKTRMAATPPATG